MVGKVVEPFQVSLSAFQTWQKCEYRYYLGYVRRLRKRDQFAAPTHGRLLHEYLEYYNLALREGHRAEDAHLAAQIKTSEKFIPEIRGYVNTALLSGNEDLARELNEIPQVAGRITDRYFVTRGKPDSERYKVLNVEKRLQLKLAEDIYSTGVADLLTQDQETGRVNLWEHKSTKTVPENSVRLRDFQTMLYATKYRWQYGTIIDSIIWNYIRTKEPVTPEVLKSGAVTKRKDLDSTWEIYSDVVRSEGGNPDSPEYSEVKERLFDRELTVFFPRYEQVIVVSEEVLMNDYVEEAKRMKAARESWMAGSSHPIRSISRDCDWCEFFKICQAALTGGDEEDVIQMGFTS